MGKREDKQQGFPGQHEDEEILLVFRQHPLIMRKQFLIGSALLLLFALPVGITPSLAPNLIDTAFKLFFLGIFVVFGYWFWVWIGWFYSVYIVTSERMVEVKQRGFFNRKVTEFGLDKVQNVNYHIKGFQAVLFQYGDIVAQTYVGDLVMRMIHKPVKIHGKIIDIVRQFESTSPPDL